MKPHIAVLDPAAKTAELDCFNRLSRRAPVPLTYHLPGLLGLDSLRRSEEGLVGILILGSATSVYDAHPWLRELGEWLMPKLKSGTPTFGICFGHQLIAHLWGAKVGFVHPGHEKLQGFRRVNLEATPLWNSLPTSGPLFVSHRETVLECPKGFKVSVRSSEIAIDGLMHDELPIITTQAHPEATEGLLHNLGYAGPTGDLSYGHSLVDAFLAMVAIRQK